VPYVTYSQLHCIGCQESNPNERLPPTRIEWQSKTMQCMYIQKAHYITTILQSMHYIPGNSFTFYMRHTFISLHLIFFRIHEFSRHFQQISITSNNDISKDYESRKVQHFIVSFRYTFNPQQCSSYLDDDVYIVAIAFTISRSQAQVIMWRRFSVRQGTLLF
jgi:hypothetical protein